MKLKTATLKLEHVAAVVPAAGIGARMVSNRPKQYLSVGSYTLLEYAIKRLLCHPRIQSVVVVLHPDDQLFWQLPVATEPRIKIATGDVVRAGSVLSGLRLVEQSWVLVHDAVRPCLSQPDLDRLIETIDQGRAGNGAILATPVRDTLKRSANGVTIDRTIPRDDLWCAMTPQLFPTMLLRKCLERALADGIAVTDESAALEHCGYTPEIVPGEPCNIKVTYPSDLILASSYLAADNDNGELV